MTTHDPTDAPATLEVEYFDGRTARAHAVVLRVEAGTLHVDGEDLALQVPLAGLAWPERTRHGRRLMHLPGGGSLHARDSATWDAWSARVAGRRDSIVVKAQQRWRWVAASLATLLVIVWAGYRWGVPAAADAIAARMPDAVSVGIGDAALSAIDAQGLVGPSKLDAKQRQALRDAFARAVATLPPGTAPHYQLEFRAGTVVGANAFALPGGPIILTDELVERAKGDADMVVGVLGHELGHLRRRHGMRLLVQAGLVGAATSLFFGDFSSLLAIVPTWLVQASYSRDAEREADAESVRLLRAAGISPEVMARFFRQFREGAKGAAPPASGPGIAWASHPGDAERIEFFEREARTH